MAAWFQNWDKLAKITDKQAYALGKWKEKIVNQNQADKNTFELVKYRIKIKEQLQIIIYKPKNIYIWAVATFSLSTQSWKFEQKIYLQRDCIWIYYSIHLRK